MAETLTLTKPIPGIGGVETKELSFRELTGADLMACGDPMAFRPAERKGDKPVAITDPGR